MSGKNNGAGNGSGNGHDKDEDEAEIIDFASSLADRDRKRREKKKEEAAWRKQYKKDNAEPFFNAGNIPFFTRLLAASFVLIHLPLAIFYNDPGESFRISYTFGFVPGMYTGTVEWTWFALFTPITYLFIHSGWMHVGFNTVMMVVMGLFTEKNYGSKRMLACFFGCGLLGVLFFFLLNPLSTYPVVGASGAISGLFAITFLTMLQQGNLGVIGSKGPLPLIIFWALLLTGMGMLGGNVAWQAHLGGFLGGVALFYSMRRGYF